MMSKRAAIAELLPTEQRFRHGFLKTEQAAIIGPSGRVIGHARQFREMQATALQRLASRFPEDLTPRLVRAGMQLRDDWEDAGVEPRQTSAYSPLGSPGSDDSEETPIARTKAAGRALDHIPMRTVRTVVEYVVIHDLEDNRVGLLKVGLVQLARYYRLED